MVNRDPIPESWIRVSYSFRSRIALAGQGGAEESHRRSRTRRRRSSSSRVGPIHRWLGLGTANACRRDNRAASALPIAIRGSWWTGVSASLVSAHAARISDGSRFCPTTFRQDPTRLRRSQSRRSTPSLAKSSRSRWPQHLIRFDQIWHFRVHPPALLQEWAGARWFLKLMLLRTALSARILSLDELRVAQAIFC